jgi:hypothetical protein
VIVSFIVIIRVLVIVMEVGIIVVLGVVIGWCTKTIRTITLFSGVVATVGVETGCLT